MAAKVDRKFDAHRRWKAQREQPTVQELSDGQIKRIGEVYYAFRLEEDEDTRVAGFYEEGEPVRPDPAPSFDEHVDDHELVDQATRQEDYARGKPDTLFLGEAEEVLSWEGVEIKLARDSSSWRKLARELQAASIRAGEAVRARNKGDVIETPEASGTWYPDCKRLFVDL